jgi:hypothetical protein
MNQSLKNIVASLLLSSIISPLQAAPDTEGAWSEQADWPMIPIHAVLTPQGKVLTWGVDGIDSGQFKYDVWSPEGGLDATSHYTFISDINVSSFCSAGLVLPETGNVLMPGGEAPPDGNYNSGIVSVVNFNPENNALTNAASMSFARWYPTSVTLPDGDILVSGGQDGQYREVVTPEVYSPATDQWRSLLGIQTTDYGYFYPKLWVVPDGRVFGMQGDQMFYMTAAEQGTLATAGFLPPVSIGNSATAVMYRPGKIMQVSGENSLTPNGALLVDVTGSDPIIRETTPLTEEGRMWANSVVLPNGKVMIVGGSAVKNVAEGMSFRPEIWDPSTEQWSLMAQSQRMRLYHSTAILLKDGRILVSGGGAPGPVINKNAEIFTPPYLFDESGLAARPTITSAPVEAPYGENISVDHPDSDTITRVTLIKTSAVTHAVNMEQRFIEADFIDTYTGVRVTIPESPNIATPGHYLMFLINDKGVPSQGHIIRISETAVYDAGASPQGNPDTAEASSGETITIDVLANDGGNGLVLETSSSWSLKGGRVGVSDNRLTYFPDTTYNGEDKIWYNFNDAKGRGSWGEVTINVTGGVVTELPVANPDNVDSTGVPMLIDALANDTGIGLELLAPNEWSLRGGRVSLVDNKISYSPRVGYTGEDKIWYTLKDFGNRESWSVVTIDVVGEGVFNPAPIGTPDEVTASTATNIIIDVLANDIGNDLVLNPVNSAYSLNGGAVSRSDNKLNYQSKADFLGEDKIWYTFVEAGGRTSWGEVTINVTE